MSSFDIDYILNLLPHGYPFVLVDRIEELVSGPEKGSRLGHSVRALKNVTFTEPFFQGHFPGKPIMPGVLLIEAMAQAAALAVFRSEDVPIQMMIAGLSRAKFRTPVVPGMQLILGAEVIKDRKRIVILRCTARVDDNIVAEAEIMAHIQTRVGEKSS